MVEFAVATRHYERLVVPPGVTIPQIWSTAKPEITDASRREDGSVVVGAKTSEDLKTVIEKISLVFGLWE